MPTGLASPLPDTLHLPQGQPFRLYSEDAEALDDKVANMLDPLKARELLLSWGWEENAFRIFASDDPPPNAAGWVEVRIDRFTSADGAAAALPYLAAARRNALEYQPVSVGLFADPDRGHGWRGRQRRRAHHLRPPRQSSLQGHRHYTEWRPAADVEEALATILGL